MWLAADDLAGRAAAGMDRKGAPVGTGSAELAQEEGIEIQGFVTIGTLAGAIVDKLRQDRAARSAPRVEPVAPDGNVAEAIRRLK